MSNPGQQSLCVACPAVRVRASNGRVLLVAGILALHAAMLAWIGHAYAPVYDELAHLPSGIWHWQTGNFDLYQVNPPLPRMVAALPVLAAHAAQDWALVDSSPYERSEFVVGKRFVELNGERSLWLFSLARWMCIPFSVLGGYFCFRWASELFDFSSGVVAVVLWCVCPNVLAWGGLVMPDIPAASVGVAAAYAFWRWLQSPGLTAALIAALALGLAELTKSTWILLFALWPCLWILTRCLRKGIAAGSRSKEALQMAAMMLIALLILNAGYLFHGTFTRLDAFEFTSPTLGGVSSSRTPGNSLRGTFWGARRLPLPANYLRGLDAQKHDFDVGRWSYLGGTQIRGGWYHYYLVCLVLKTPLGTLGLAILALVLAIVSRKYRLAWRDELVLWLPALVIVAVVSSQIGFSRYFRYMLPALPLAFISIGRVGLVFSGSRRLLQSLAMALLACSVAASLWIYPHSMSYFNSLAGGPLGGPAYLLDANVDWGQDLLYLKRWMASHPEATPLHLKYFGYLAPEILNLRTLSVPPRPTSKADTQQAGPQPGWYAVSVNEIYGYRHYSKPHPHYTYFKRLTPVARAGYSIYIYHVSLDDANRVRRKFRWQPLIRAETSCSGELIAPARRSD